MKVYFIAGTDTEVGKTYITTLLCSYFRRKNYKVGALKPIESGVKYSKIPDYKLIAEASGDNEKPIYLLNEPLAPYIAAKIDKVRIDKRKILDFYFRDINDHNYDYYFIEGAGGLFVPINDDLLYIDLVKEFKCEVILVARTNLGTVNHTLLSIEALEKRSIPLKGIILNEILETDEFMIEHNREMIERFSGYRVLTIVRKGQNEILNIVGL